MDIESEVIKFLGQNPNVAREAVRIEGIDPEDISRVLTGLAMAGRLNQINGLVSLSGK